MMLLKLAFLAVLALVSSETDDELLARAHNGFAVKLLKHFAAHNPPSNVFFSPTGIAAAFGMAYVGARGSSAAEISLVLGHTGVGLAERSRILAAYKNLLKLGSSPDVTLETANLVLAQDSFHIYETYRTKLQDAFGAELMSVDFANEGPRVASRINSWVREKTRGKIKSILYEDRPLYIDLLILNAVYFNARWETAFNHFATRNRPFFNQGIHLVSKPAMYRSGHMPFNRLDVLQAAAVEIPYLEDRFSMVVILPDSRRGLPALRDRLSVAVLEGVERRLSSRLVELTLPKFDMSLRYALVPAMQALGMNVVFGGGANFTGISRGRFLRISDAVHKAVIEVNEDGTVAAAMPPMHGMGASPFDRPEQPIQFVVDRPFLFYIRDRIDKRILFIGEVQSL